MDQEPRNGSDSKSASGRRGSHARPFERRPSKKSTSKDRHGRVYPETFRDTSIRTVTPDSSDPANQSPLSDNEYPSTSATASPRASVRSKARERPREFSPMYSTGDDEELSVEHRSLRARSRTTTLEDQRSELSPSSYFSRNRTRLGSLNTASPSTSKTSEDSVSSIGYPSIVQSPTQRHPRPAKSPAGPSATSLVASASRGETPNTPLSNADATRVLQLMKTTCGRMHGILSFRYSGSASWASGYCAINVSSGSLIYQAKGDTAINKTLVPDLRGCRVRTLYDAELPGSYLSVSTHSSALGIHLRPHVIETIDSWLAALLCWQPIRPKGVQNKMTKPQSVVIGDTRPSDRRRNSESTIQKDPAIIKIGKMLLWDKQSTSGAFPSITQRRGSTIRQHRAVPPPWRRVNCMLLENGHMKIYAERESELLCFIQLSRLCRCAIQQVEPSVLRDDFCVAIYPQYTANSGPDQTMRPVYLALENRVLFEVWFVLLRAFTIPELYGPSGEEDPRSHALPVSQSRPVADLFRIERLLSVRVIEAKMTGVGGEEDVPDPNKSKASSIGHQSTAGAAGNVGDYYAEVVLDGEIRAKTVVKHETASPFWREDFSFHDLPPVLSSASVVVKTLNPTQKDWTLVARGSYTLDESDTDPTAMFGDVEISSYDPTYGSIELRLDDFEPGVEVEKWWPILNDRDESVGEILMKVQLDEIIVLMLHEYKELSDLLHSFPNGLTVSMAQLVPGELRLLAESLLDIFQVSGQVGEWIVSLVEEEIDGIHRETTASRLRYTSRIHSNESYESGPERELLVRDLGRSATVEANLLFRGNSLLTKALDLHMRRLGQTYLEDTIGHKLRDIDESDPDCEIDPNRVSRSEDLDRNWRNLIALTSNIWSAIAGSASLCPADLRHIFRHIRACAEDRYGDFLRSVPYSSVSGFLFLRFFCPAILNPKLFGLLKEHPRPRSQRTFTLIAKALQGLANLTTFGNKEPWMEPMNKFLISHRTQFKEFVDSICSIPADRQAETINASYATPIQILSRLPSTSREGFPSLPYLIDNARSFAVLVRMWLAVAPSDLDEIPELDENVTKFHDLCLQVQQRAKDCLNRAEQAERPSGNLEDKWEELVEQMEKSGTFYEDSPSAASTPAVETTMAGAAAAAGSNRNSIGYFASRPPLPHRSTDVSLSRDYAEDDPVPSSSSSATWEQGQGRSYYYPHHSKHPDARESIDSSHNSSTYSLDDPDAQKGARSNTPRHLSSKNRILGFVTSSRRKMKDKESSSTASADTWGSR